MERGMEVRSAERLDRSVTQKLPHKPAFTRYTRSAAIPSSGEIAEAD